MSRIPEDSATAARRFSDLPDAMEHQGEQFAIVRRGKAVAHIEPVSRGRGADVKALLRGSHPDRAWASQLDDVRELLEVGDDDVAIAAITVAELFVGIELATTRHRPSREEFVDGILSVIPVLGYDVTADATAFADLPGVTVKAHR